MRAKLAYLSHCAVLFLSRADANLRKYKDMNQDKLVSKSMDKGLKVIYLYLPKTENFDCVGRGDLTSLFFSKVAK